MFAFILSAAAAALSLSLSISVHSLICCSLFSQSPSLCICCRNVRAAHNILHASSVELSRRSSLIIATAAPSYCLSQWAFDFVTRLVCKVYKGRTITQEEIISFCNYVEKRWGRRSIPDTVRVRRAGD